MAETLGDDVARHGPSLAGTRRAVVVRPKHPPYDGGSSALRGATMSSGARGSMEVKAARNPRNGDPRSEDRSCPPQRPRRASRPRPSHSWRTPNRRPPRARCCGTSRCRWTASWRGRATSMDWMTGSRSGAGLVEEYVRYDRCRTGWPGRLRTLSRRRASTAARGRGRCSSSRTTPTTPQPVPGVTFLTCDVAEAVRIGLEAADGKNLEVFSPTIGRQLLERGLIEEIDLHIVPVLLGDGDPALRQPRRRPGPARAAER